jgi:hypothetical protein
MKMSMKTHLDAQKFAVFISVSIILTLLFMLKGTVGPPDFDEKYHFATIEEFSNQLPSPDISSMETATGPLWHLAVATSVKIFGFGVESSARISALAFSIAFLFVLVFYLVPDAEFGVAIPLTLIVAFNPTFIWFSTLAMTEIPALLFVGGFLALIVSDRQPDNSTAILMALLLSAAVWTRQTWVVLMPLAFLPLIDTDALSLRGLLRSSVMVYALIVLILCGFLFYVWGGLSPPGEYATHHNPTFTVEQLYFGAALFCLYYWPVTFYRKFNIKLALLALIVALSTLMVDSWIAKQLIALGSIANPQGLLQGALNIVAQTIHPWAATLLYVAMIGVGFYAAFSFALSKKYDRHSLVFACFLLLTLLSIVILPQPWERYWLSWLLVFPIFLCTGISKKRGRIILWVTAINITVLGFSYTAYQLVYLGERAYT